MADTKYGHLLKRLNFQERPDVKSARFGGSDLEGMNLSFSWVYSNMVGEYTPGKTGGHVHPCGECFVFAGLDYNNPNYLGAEIEEAMGEEGEKHIFDTTTAIAVPAGFPHNPMVARKADEALYQAKSGGRDQVVVASS